MLISIHMPKCGGTSFIQILKNLYGDKLFFDNGINWAINNRQPLVMSPKTCCIHGHFFANKYDYISNKSLITWVRHPVQRVLSHYYFFLRNPHLRDNPDCRALHENRLSLVQFASLERIRNHMSYYFAGKSLLDFDFVGIVEFYEESLDIFFKLIQASTPFGVAYKKNENPNKSSQYNISKKETDALLELNALDVALYQEALDNFHSK